MSNKETFHSTVGQLVEVQVNSGIDDTNFVY